VLRSSVVSLGDSRPVFQAYTTIISSLLNFSDQLATGTTDHDLGNLVSTLSLVEQAGEQTSQERGYLVSIIGGGGQIRVQQEALIQAQAKYTSALGTLTAQASPATANLFQSTVGGQSTGTADSLVQQVIDAALENRAVATIGADPVGAFNAATAKITQVRQVENQVGAQALARTSFLQSAARTQLYVNAGIVILTLLLAFAATAIIARSIVEPLKVLRTSAYQIATVGLPAVIRRLRDAADVDAVSTRVEPIAVLSRDEIGAVARAFDEVHDAAVRLATEQALLRGNVNAMFKNLSRRSQGLVERQLLLIDGLENSEKDPGQLAQLFKLDHLATRMRRNNENLLVLAGEETARRWTEAVQLVDVARAAAAEVEQYERIMFGEIPRTRIVGKAAPDVAHLVAELLENATTYSSPQTKVWVAARGADDGGVILHIEDVGIGMTAADLQRSNERLSRPPLVDVGVSRQMGLFVVGRLAARYGIRVTLSESPAGGVTASIHLPVTLVDLGAMAARRPDDSGMQQRVTVPGIAREGFTGGALLDQGRVADDGSGGEFGRTRRLGEPPIPPPPDRNTGTGYREPPLNGSGRFGANPVLPGPFEAPPMPGQAQPSPAGAVPGADAQRSGAQRFDSQQAGTQRSDAQRSDAQRSDVRRSNATVYVDGAPSAPGEDPAWFEPKQAMREGEPPRPRPESGRTQIPQPRTGPASAHEIRQAARADTAVTDTNERLPIFEAVESEWFRRRGTRPPHSGWSPRSVQPWDATRAANGAAQGAPRPRATQLGQGPLQPGQGSPAPQSANTGQFEPQPAAARAWSSPGDEAWKAAAALANPVRDGVTDSGLPRRVPKANLVPGKAGANGAAKVSPPPGISNTAEAVRRRLSTFRRNSQQLAGESEQ
jgi:signal transduction histidine kinase